MGCLRATAICGMVLDALSGSCVNAKPSFAASIANRPTLMSTSKSTSDMHTSMFTCRGGFSDQSCPNTDATSAADVLSEIQTSLLSGDDQGDEMPLSYLTDIASAARDFSPGDNKGRLAWNFLNGIASSPTFRTKFWHQQPLLIRSKNTGSWVSGAFTLERDLKIVGDSYITGHATAKELRNGTKTDTWGFQSLKENPARKTTWEEVEEALKGGTIYFNTAGSLWPTLGALCRLTNAAFGIPSNVNVYVTEPGVTLSVPPHTDRQDVLVFQTAGAKRWRVYAPPPRRAGVDALNRGKAGDVLSFEEMGEPLIDTVLKQGDVLYVPTGFPHTTDTCTVVDDDHTDHTDHIDDNVNVFDETSIHLTMGLDTHVWGLTFAHLRWSLLQRASKEFQINMKDDEKYWAAMDAIPIGFLGGEAWKRCLESVKSGTGSVDPEYQKNMTAELKRIMILMEPERWQELGEVDDNDSGSDNSSKETMPEDDKFGEVIYYMVKDHLLSLFDIQEIMFSNIDPKSEESLIKAFQCGQKQNLVMEKFGIFSKNEAMTNGFAQKRRQVEAQTKGIK